MLEAPKRLLAEAPTHAAQVALVDVFVRLGSRAAPYLEALWSPSVAPAPGASFRSLVHDFLHRFNDVSASFVFSVHALEVRHASAVRV
jgi:hypothetical protein